MSRFVFLLGGALLAALVLARWTLPNAVPAPAHPVSVRQAPLAGGAAEGSRSPASADEGVRNAARRAAELVSVPSPAAPAAAAAANDVALGARPSPEAMPRPGALRIVGVVVNEDGERVPLPDARAHFIRTSDSGERARDLGEVSASSGSFTFDVPQPGLARLRRAGAPRGSIECVVSAPGYEVSSETVDAADAVDGVLRVQLVAWERALLVRGRVVAPDGTPVLEADVRVIDFGSLDQEIELHELQTDPAGRFQMSLDRLGIVDVVARHSRHGVAKVEQDGRAGTRLIDFGDVVLRPRGVLSGTLLGYGRAPLAQHLLSLAPLDDSEGRASYDQVTDDDGRFCFACLDAVPYRLYVNDVDVDDEARPIFTPDAVGLEVTAPIASARVQVVDGDGVPADGVELAVRAVRRVEGEWRVGGPGDADVRPSKDEPGLYYVTFSHPTTYSLAAGTTIGAVRWSAKARIEAGAGFHDVRLVLAPVASPQVDIAVEAPAGEPVATWEVRFVEPETGISVSCTSRVPHVRLSAGNWTAHVKPDGDSDVLPFTRSVEVAEGTERISLRGAHLGGRLTVRLEGSGGRALPTIARLRAVDGALSESVRLDEGRDVTLARVLPAGDYELSLAEAPQFNVVFGLIDGKHSLVDARGPAQAAAKWLVTIRAGETAWLRVTGP
ncbi:MAG: hypothetical protein R3F49_11780 [Planctomycetota bacterium]